MDGYYDYGPSIDLDRHLVLSGLVAEDTQTIGYRLASVTGLPFLDLDRRIEHHAGMSIWTLAREGTAHFRRVEAAVLERVLADRPFGVVVLGDGTLLEPDNRERIERRSYLVSMDDDIANAYWRLARRARRRGGRWHPLDPAPLEHIDQVRPFHALRQPGAATFDRRIALTGRRLGEVADELESWLLATVR